MNTLTSLHTEYWAQRAADRFSRGGTVIGIPYRDRGDDAYIEMKRRQYAAEDAIFKRNQAILLTLLAALS